MNLPAGGQASTRSLKTSRPDQQPNNPPECCTSPRERLAEYALNNARTHLLQRSRPPAASATEAG